MSPSPAAPHEEMALAPESCAVHPSQANGLIHEDATSCTRLVSEIRPHPRIVQLQLTPSFAKMSALTDRGDLAFKDPLTVTHEGIILDGFARWSLASLQGHVRLPCNVRHLDEADALVYLLQGQRRSPGLNDFIRICLALELEPHFRAQARARQRLGGEKKLSSNLTEAQRIDVRARIADAAGVCAANVTKVKSLIDSAHVAVLAALRVEEIRIHRAWKWLESSKDGGLQDYKSFCNEAGMRGTIRTLIAQQVSRRLSIPDDLIELRTALCALSGKPRFKGLVQSMEDVLRAFDAKPADKLVHDVAA